jgi:WD40 repeat protein/serine/threonine protein kinase/tetratricopeptide (TPR) repeat protein
MSAHGSSKYALLDQLAEEFATRYRRGECPSVQDYLDKYPELAEDIRAMLPAMVEIEQVKADHGKHSAPTAPPAAGTVPPLDRVGDYRIIRVVGQGGMGVVYEAEQVSLGRRVALKVLPLHASRDGKALERFKREARSAARLHHTNIVPVFEVGQDGDVCYYAMQFIPGQGLDQVVEELRRLRSDVRVKARQAPAEAAKRPVPDAPVSEVRQLAHSLVTGDFQPQPAEVSTPPPSQPARPAARTDGYVPADADPSAVQGASSGSSPVVLPGQTDLSSVQSAHDHYFHSVARIGHQAATALAYAHARGVVHRDIKPSNLLLDAAGVVWITDFGLAKTEEGALTNTGDIVGTLRYMAPERLRGECDARADVYGLGLTLYELLLLRPAFQARDRMRLLDVVANEEPARPRAVDPRIPRDLETIVLKAIDKDPARRYPSAEALAEDLRRFAGDEPIKARRASPAERLARWCRRNPAVAGLLLIVAMSLVLGASVSAIFAIRATENAREAHENEVTAWQEKANTDAALASASTARTEAERARREAQDNLYNAEMNLAGQAAEAAGGMGRTQALLAHWRPLGDEQDRRGWEWYYLKGMGQQAMLTWHQPLRDVLGLRIRADKLGLSWSPDGQKLARSGEDGKVRVWDVTTGRMVLTIRGHQTAVYSLSWSPDGQHIATAAEEGAVRVWDAETGRLVSEPLRGLGGVGGVAWSPDGGQLATCHWDGLIAVWDVGTGRRTALLRGHAKNVLVSWSPDGRRLASAGLDRTVRVWDVRRALETAAFRGHTQRVVAVRWSPDGQTLASGSHDQTVRLSNPDTGQEIGQPLRGHTGPVTDVQWSSDGRRLASVGDYTVRIWEPGTGRETVVFRGHLAMIVGVCWRPDDRRLASVSLDHTIRVWDTETRQASPIVSRHTERFLATSWSPDGRWLASASADKSIKLWDATSRQEIAALRGHEDEVWSVSWSPNGMRLASAGKDHTVKIWDFATRQVTATLRGHNGPVWTVAWSPDDRTLASGSLDHTVRLWDVTPGRSPRVVRILAGHPGENGIFGMSWSPDGKTLASGGDMVIKLWNPATGQEVQTLGGYAMAVSAVSWSPRGNYLASANDVLIKLWDTATGQEKELPHGGARALSWSPNGLRLASGSGDGTVQLWDASTGQGVLTLGRHTSAVRGLSWSPDGLRLASAGYDGTVRVWDATAGYAADHSPHLLPALDRRLDAQLRSASDLRLRAEVQARLGHWDQAAADWSESSGGKESPSPAWFQAGWWVAGPFAATALETPECGIEPDPLQPIPGADGSAVQPAVRHWQAATASDNGCLDFGALAQGKASTAYALLRVYSPRQQPITALISSTGPVRLWHNGVALHPLQREPAADAEEGVPLTLRDGWNTLLFQVGLGKATNCLYLWLSDKPADCVHALADHDRWDEAQALVKDIQAHQPDQAATLLAAGQLFRRYADRLHQQGQHEQTAEQEREGRACYEKLLALQPDHAGYALEFAEYLLGQVVADGQLGRQDKARQDYDQAVTLMAKYPVQESLQHRLIEAASSRIEREPENTSLRVQRGRALLGARRFEDAAKDFTRALETQPDNAEAWLGRGRAYHTLNQPDKAIEDLNRALRLQPRNHTARQARGEIYVGLKNWDKALGDYNVVVELQPDDPESLETRADLLARAGQWAPAAADFKRLAAMPFPTSRPWHVWYRQALALLGAGKTAEYRQVCAAMLEHFKDTDDPQVALFTAWSSALAPDAVPDFSLPTRLADRALSGNADLILSHQGAGAILYRAGQFSEALKHLQSAEGKANPENRSSFAYVWYFRAMTHYRLGQKEEATKWLERANTQAEQELPGIDQNPELVSWVRKPTLQLLRAEAEKLLREPPKPKPEAKDKSP